jgi:hypothetical protein
MNKLVQFLLIVVLIFGGWKLLSWRIQGLDTPTPSPYVQYIRHASVDVITEEKEKLINEVEFNEGENVVDVTRKVLPIELKDNSVRSINNRMIDSKKKEYWALAVNGKVQNIDYKVQAGDVIAWTLKTR